MSLNLLLLRLTFLRCAMPWIWVIFLFYLSIPAQHFSFYAWLLLLMYLPLVASGWWQAKHRVVSNTHLIIHLALEAQLLAGILFFTGGVTNPLISYFLILLVMAAYSLPVQQAMWITLLAIADYSMLTQWYQPLASQNSHDLTGHDFLNWHLIGMWLTFVVSALIVLLLIPQLVRARQQQQAELQQLREQQLKHEQLIGIATLAAGTAHEMGTPLMTMDMLLEDLKTETANNPDDLELLQQQVNRCRESLQRLTQAGQTVHQQGCHDSGEWLKNLLSRWQLSHPGAHWQDNNIQATGLIARSPLLDQALLNLLDNAAEAGTEAVRLTTRVDDDFWYLDIHQSDPDAQHQLLTYTTFESHKEYGMGIGMYLSNASIEQFGGHIHLAAHGDGGSLCSLSLPLEKSS